MSYGLGVDLGTTFTAAATYDNGSPTMVGLGNRALQIPSVLYMRPGEPPLVGEAAERRGLADPGPLVREFKRRFGDPVPIMIGGTPYSAPALSAHLLRWVLQQTTERLGAPPTSVTLTRPANWGDFKLDLLRDVARLADVHNALTCTEPEAAAVQYAARHQVSPGEKIAIYDLGGGTFDICFFVRTTDGFQMVGRPDGIEQLGGVDFDEAVFQFVIGNAGLDLDRVDPGDSTVVSGLRQLRRNCVDAKEALSQDVDTVVPVTVADIRTSVRITRPDFAALILPALEDTVRATQRGLRSSGLSPEDISTFVLVGGSSRIPLVSEVLARAFHCTVARDTHPKHDVAMGAARVGSTPAMATELLPLDTSHAGRRPAAPTAGAKAAAITFGPAAGAEPTAEPNAENELTPKSRAGHQSSEPADVIANSAGHRRAWMVAMAAALVVAITAGIWVLAPGDQDGAANRNASDSATSSSSNSPTPGVTTPAAFEPFAQTAKFRSLPGPIDLEVVDNDLWVMSQSEGTLQRFDITTPVPQFKDKVFLGYKSGRNGSDIIKTAGALYVTQYDNESVARVDLSTTPVTVTQIEVPGRPLNGTVLDGKVWVTLQPHEASAEPMALLPIEGTAIGQPVPLPQLPYQLLAVGSELWMTFDDDDRVGHFDPRDGAGAMKYIEGLAEPIDLLAVGEEIWVTLRDGENVAVVRRKDDSIRHFIQAGSQPFKLIEAFGSVWVTNNGNGADQAGSVSRLSPGNRRREQADIIAGFAPLELAATTDRVFVGNFGDSTVSILTPVVLITDRGVSDARSKPGETVFVQNDDAEAQALTSADDSFSTGKIPPGSLGSFVAPSTTGTYAFATKSNPSLKASLVVE